MSAKYQTSDWIWVFYPFLTVVFMLLGINFLVNNGQTSLDSLMVNQEQIEAERQRAENLRMKLELLKTIEKETSLQQLERMLMAMPASRQVWLLMNELNVLGQRSGMSVETYKGTVGDVREATESAKSATESAQAAGQSPTEMILQVKYELVDIRALATALAESEKLLPLVKIVKVDFEKDQVEMHLEGAWSAWPAASNDPEMQLVFSKGQIAGILSKLDEYEVLPLNSDTVTILETEEATASGLPEG